MTLKLKLLPILAVVWAAGPGLGVAQAQLDPARVLQELELRESDKPVREMKGWVKPKKIVILADSTARLKWFQEVAPGVELVAAASPAEAAKHAKDADAIVGICQPDAVNASKKLKWVQMPSAGTNECLAIPRLAKGDVLVTNMQRVYGPPIAEHVIASLFYIARNFGQFTQMQKDENWNQTAIPQNEFMELQGKTMLVVGLGGIGSAVAERAHALGMKVIATRNSSREKPDYVEYVGLSNELMDLTPKADVVVNAAPLTPETQGLFNAAFFAKMKPKSYFLNVGRGAQVDQNALIAALTEKRIAGAAIDVADPEPLPKGHPLWKAPNLFITPHTSSFSDIRFDRVWIVIRENLKRYVAGDKMYSVVDVKRGY
ncbi:MAG: D-2-hydroxyacid dehydrogenase [Rhodospirillaceae bacterium]|nr:D-2-hydroxyacid dehydrogenase [Rhodospirillaceae bacterium]